MNNTLYYREVTKEDYCPKCNHFLIVGCEDGWVQRICFHCGHRQKLEHPKVKKGKANREN